MTRPLPVGQRGVDRPKRAPTCPNRPKLGFLIGPGVFPGTLAAVEPDRAQTIATSSGRSFATFPAAVVVSIVNRQGELLLLESPRRPGWWEPVNGAVDDGETLLEARSARGA